MHQDIQISARFWTILKALNKEMKSYQMTRKVVILHLHCTWEQWQLRYKKEKSLAKEAFNKMKSMFIDRKLLDSKTCLLMTFVWSFLTLWMWVVDIQGSKVEKHVSRKKFGFIDMTFSCLQMEKDCSWQRLTSIVVCKKLHQKRKIGGLMPPRKNRRHKVVKGKHICIIFNPISNVQDGSGALLVIQKGGTTSLKRGSPKTRKQWSATDR